MAKIVIILETDTDSDSDDLLHVVDRMLDGGSLQDAISETHDDLYGAPIEFSSALVFGADSDRGAADIMEAIKTEG
jgi:hypothetical protein